MRHILIGFVAAMAMVALAGCDASGGPPGTPGTATVSMHGSIGTSIGVSSR
ncbi:MAG TPA: hypothetical protein VGM42_03590 [Rhodopila sp.]